MNKQSKLEMTRDVLQEVTGGQTVPVKEARLSDGLYKTAALWRTAGNLLKINNRLPAGMRAIVDGGTPVAELKRVVGSSLRGSGSPLTSGVYSGMAANQKFYNRLKLPEAVGDLGKSKDVVFRGISLANRPYAQTIKTPTDLSFSGGYAGGYLHATPSPHNAAAFSDTFGRLTTLGAYKGRPNQILSQDFGLENVLAASGSKWRDVARKYLNPGSGWETPLTPATNPFLGAFIRNPATSSSQGAWKHIQGGNKKDLQALTHYLRETETMLKPRFNPSFRQTGDAPIHKRLQSLQRNNLPAFDELMRRRVVKRFFPQP